MLFLHFGVFFIKLIHLKVLELNTQKSNISAEVTRDYFLY